MHNIKKKIKGIIFDLDGTIITTEHIWEKVTKDFMFSKGITYLTDKQINLFRKNSSGGLIRFSEVVKQEFNLSDTVEQIVNYKTNMFFDYMKKYPINFINGFESFHKRVQQYLIPNGIATNSTIRTLQTIIPKMKLNKFFGEHIYSMEHVQNRAKPDPALFLHVAEKLNVKPKECIIFEDSLAGFKAARNAGIKCIAIKNDNNQEILHKADYVISNYHEAEEVLKKI